jgi:acetyltransferase-like isoleucine patch superfamily enzyme
MQVEDTQEYQSIDLIRSMLRHNFIDWWLTEEHVAGRVELETPCNLAAGLGVARTDVFVGAFTACFSFVSSNVGRIGRYCSIADGVVLGHVEHPTDWFTTLSIAYDSNVFRNYIESKGGSLMRRYDIPESKKTNPIELGNDVWIGYQSYIRSGTVLGDGCIVGSNAVVTKDVPPYAIVVGNPARVVKYRFNEKIISRLAELQWWNYDFTDFKNVDGSNIEKFCDDLQRLIEDGLKPYSPRALIVTGNGQKGGLRCRLKKES